METVKGQWLGVGRGVGQRIFRAVTLFCMLRPFCGVVNACRYIFVRTLGMYAVKNERCDPWTGGGNGV